jgi:hypothetical protein
MIISNISGISLSSSACIEVTFLCFVYSSKEIKIFCYNQNYAKTSTLHAVTEALPVTRYKGYLIPLKKIWHD